MGEACKAGPENLRKSFQFEELQSAQIISRYLKASWHFANEKNSLISF